MTWSPDPPHTVARPVMRMRWNVISFLHWRVEAAAVQERLPDWLTVQERDGSAWVSLVPFAMRVGPPIGPKLPYVGHFPETNVRTYVTGPDGREGIWFFSLEASRLPVVTTARSTYLLPYMWARMSITRAGDRISYRSKRLFPGPRGARCECDIQPGDRLDGDDLDHFLTARYGLWSPGSIYTPSEHERWDLYRARVTDLRDDLVRSAGFEVSGDPIVHFAEGREVKIGAPQIVRARTPSKSQ